NSLLNYVDYMAKEKGFSLEARQDIYSSDCMPFVDAGIPAINFARFGADGAAHIHDSYDKMGFISANSLESTGNIVEEFANRMANAYMMPVPKKIPDNIVDKVNKYLKKSIKKD
ncbi:MAG: M28 family peptidase, partial [Erysipelotrichales bacterium]|nr:M28 family peptidase [Erysipelotrichales bacterium]